MFSWTKIGQEISRPWAVYGSHFALSLPLMRSILDQKSAHLDPTVPPPHAIGQRLPVSCNHCFAQIIKKSGHLCLTLDIRVVCAYGAASLVFAEDHVYGGRCEKSSKSNAGNRRQAAALGVRQSEWRGVDALWNSWGEEIIGVISKNSFASITFAKRLLW